MDGNEAQVAREIVERHRGEFPAFITDFAIKLGRSDGEPALFVLYKTTGEDGDFMSEEWKIRADQYHQLDEIVLPELIDTINSRYSYSFLVPDWHWDTFPD